MATRVATYDRRIFGGFKTLVFCVLRHDFVSNRIVTTMIPVLDVLFRKSTVCRFLVPSGRISLHNRRQVIGTHLNGH